MNEREYAENAIRARDLGTRPYDTLCRVAKYYYLDHSKKDIRRMLDQFLIQCDPSASLTGWSDTLDYIVKNINKYPLIEIDNISISKSEMGKIDKADSVQARRLAFTLLCISKYWDIVYTLNNHWVNTPDSEIMKMANISTSIKRQSILYAKLNDMQLIRFSKKVDNTNVQVLFSDNGEETMSVSNFANLGYQYLKYHGGNFFECENCGIVTKQNDCRSNKKKYCDKCSLEIRIKRSAESMLKHRNSLKNESVNIRQVAKVTSQT